MILLERETALTTLASRGCSRGIAVTEATAATKLGSCLLSQFLTRELAMLSVLRACRESAACRPACTKPATVSPCQDYHIRCEGQPPAATHWQRPPFHVLLTAEAWDVRTLQVPRRGVDTKGPARKDERVRLLFFIDTRSSILRACVPTE